MRLTIQRRRLGAAAAVVLAAVVATYAQSSAPAPIASKEWPTYGHDPGGMRFSPLTQITPANVGQLQVAWVYHMKPARPRRRRRDAGAARAGRGRGRGGSGFASSEVDAARHRRRDVHRHAVLPRRRARPDDGQGALGFRAAVGQSVDARRRVLAGRRADAAADRLRHRATASCTRSTRRPASRTRRSATRASST